MSDNQTKGQRHHTQEAGNDVAQLFISLGEHHLVLNTAQGRITPTILRLELRYHGHVGRGEAALPAFGGEDFVSCHQALAQLSQHAPLSLSPPTRPLASCCAPCIKLCAPRCNSGTIAAIINRNHQQCVSEGSVTLDLLTLLHCHRHHHRHRHRHHSKRLPSMDWLGIYLKRLPSLSKGGCC